MNILFRQKIATVRLSASGLSNEVGGGSRVMGKSGINKVAVMIKIRFINPRPSLRNSAGEKLAGIISLIRPLWPKRKISLDDTESPKGHRSLL